LRDRLPFVVILVIIIFMISFVSSSFAFDYDKEIENKQGELDQINEELEKHSQELDNQKSQREEMLNQLNSLEAEVEKIKRELDRLNRDIQQKEDDIVTKEGEIEQAEAELQEREQGLASRLRAIYLYGSTNYLEVLFNSSSFTDFLTRFNALETIAANDSRLVQQVKAEKLRLVNEREMLEQERVQLLDMRREKIAKKEELDQKTSRQAALIAKIEESIEAEEKAIKEMESEAAAIQELIERLEKEQQWVSRGGAINLIWLLAEFQRGWITSYYGYRTHPITGAPRSFHGGIDIGIPHSRYPLSSSYNGSPVYIRAAEDGVVIYAGVSGSYGRLVIINHGGGIATVYAHNYSNLVESGQEVRQGEHIAIVGNTGSSTGPHLHFEVRVNGERVDPLGYLP